MNLAEYSHDDLVALEGAIKAEIVNRQRAEHANARAQILELARAAGLKVTFGRKGIPRRPRVKA